MKPVCSEFLDIKKPGRASLPGLFYFQEWEIPASRFSALNAYERVVHLRNRPIVAAVMSMSSLCRGRQQSNARNRCIVIDDKSPRQITYMVSSALKFTGAARFLHWDHTAALLQKKMSHLKKINVADLRLGMYLYGFDEAWIKSPFWRSKFLISDHADLQTAWTCGIETCWIDLSKGCDVAAQVPEKICELMDAETEPGLEPETTTFDQELEYAALLCQSARAATMAMFNEIRLGKAINVEGCLPLVNDIAASVLRNPTALISLARLKTSSDDTYMHSVAVCALMICLGRTLGFDPAACREAGMAGLLHDVGKALIPAEILNKPGRLTTEEFAIVKRHTLLGYALLKQDPTIPAAASEVCLRHHERMDGGGYPEGLSGNKLSLLTRMGAVCDVYDAVTSERPYKKGWDPAEALARMASWKGHFDQTVLSAFVKSLGIYPTGALVRLSSGRLAVVIEQTKASLTMPIVKVFFREEPPGPIPVELLNLSLPGIEDSIVGRASGERLNLPRLESLWAGQLATWSRPSEHQDDGAAKSSDASFTAADPG